MSEWTVEQRITDYLASGGLFNPELSDHDAVSRLLFDCRAALAAERKKAELLVDALKKCKSQLDMEPQRLPLVERLQGYIKDALAGVKEEEV